MQTDPEDTPPSPPETACESAGERAGERTGARAREIALLGGLFIARPVIHAAEARRAYALVTLSHPHVTEPQWRAFARRCARAGHGSRGSPGGLMAIKDRRGCMHALFRYAVEVSPLTGDGPTLCLRDLVLAHLPGHALVPALVLCAERLAACLDCSFLAVEVPAADASLPHRDGRAQLAAGLRSAGFSAARATMVRTLAGQGNTAG